MPEVKQLGSGRVENWAGFWGFKQVYKSRLSVGLQLSQGKEVVKTDATQLGNAMKSLYRAHWTLEWGWGSRKAFGKAVCSSGRYTIPSSKRHWGEKQQVIYSLKIGSEEGRTSKEAGKAGIMR